MTVPFFIVGPGRSGTTLLRAILDARPDVHIPGETHFYTTYRIENAMRFHFLTRTNYLKAVRRYPKWRHVSYEHLDWRRFAALASELPTSRSSVLKAYLQACAEADGASRFGEKTPGHVRTLSRLWRDFPQAKVIHIIRDPRAVAASYLRHDLYLRVFGKDVTRATLKWVEAARIHRKFCKDPRYFLLRYEDLVSSPEDVLAQMQDFLALPHDPQMLERYARAKLTLPENPNHKLINQPLSSAGLGAWRQELKVDDIALIDTLCSPFLADFGYDRVSETELPLSQAIARRLKFWATFANYRGGRFLHSLRRGQV